MKSNFDKCPSIEVSPDSRDCITGWESICKRLHEFIATRGKARVVVAIDCYHGVLHKETETALRNGLKPHLFINSTSAFLPEMDVSRMVYPDVTDDRIFGFMTRLTLEKFFDEKKLQALRKEIDAITHGVVVVYGEGAAYVAQNADVLVYLDMARWEIQLRMRRNEVGNLGVNNTDAEFSL